jgi:fibrillarin-like pre-rRNA processing protein
MKKVFEGVFEEKQDKRKFLLTENATAGKTFFSEETIKEEGREFRVWNPGNSKLAAIIIKGLNIFPFRKDSKILYLGCAHGYTVSFLSDIANKGVIIAIDFAPSMLRDFMRVAEARKNIIPILADANRPSRYYHLVPAVDVIYQDIAQRNQVEIFFKNCNLFLRKGGYGFLAVKARSIEVTKKPKSIFAEVNRELQTKLKVIAQRSLEPFQHDHMMFVVRK